jgi:hypothetical protein
MTLANALAYAHRAANRTGSSVLVYRNLAAAAQNREEYGFDFTLPMFGERVGDRIEPEQLNETCERLNA